MSLTATDKQAPAFDEAIFFTERNFGGQGYLTKLGSRVDIWREYNSLNDRLLSVKVGSSCTVVAYWAAGFGTPSKQLTADTADINISGMSGFIVTSRTGEYPVAFSFKDELGEGRRMTLKSSEFPEGGENGVVQPNGAGCNRYSNSYTSPPSLQPLTSASGPSDQPDPVTTITTKAAMSLPGRLAPSLLSSVLGNGSCRASCKSALP